MAGFSLQRANYLQWATFRGQQFFVETGSRAGGRRAAPHEFPHRDLPWTEDLGRRIVRFTITGYIIAGPKLTDYIPMRNALINVLEQPDPGELILPRILGEGPQVIVKQVICDTYNITERRERGGYAEFDMVFVERGNPVSTLVDTQAAVRNAADTASDATQQSLDSTLETQFQND